MLPMITTIAEFKRAKEMVLDCYHTLQESLTDLALPPIDHGRSACGIND